MKELNLLKDYPSSNKPRIANANIRTLKHRLLAVQRSRDFFDGKRECGYGGFKYDGRWLPILKQICEKFNLSEGSKFLHINSEKGFVLKDLKKINKKISVYGTETSQYAIQKTCESIRKYVVKAEPKELPFENKFFDFVLAIGVVYCENLKNAIDVLNEIKRVSNGQSFITLATYSNKEDYQLFKN